MKKTFLIFTVLLAMSLSFSSCSKDDVGEGNGLGEQAEAGHNEGPGSGEESGTQLGLNETFDMVRNGVRLIMSYNSQNQTFEGTIENTTNSTISQVRVEVHLSNGVELGPTTPVNLAPGEIQNVSLSASGQNFNRWSPHAETGNSGS
ncbi:hypothetical protein GWK08_09060 [Leptobacterium flavescens]|uniref:Uncharacterized protein n=1 Tax=Leptobacterium flavescens TaxID=472055 RepID=A0A6P0UK33_9FLAO|nr:FxLYD domain-containing protein [Leptobacterium flavescens]NER13584.1 hypothetical protein [Leptobacterium flavescens]